jgi:hypothetical protein
VTMTGCHGNGLILAVLGSFLDSGSWHGSGDLSRCSNVGSASDSLEHSLDLKSGSVSDLIDGRQCSLGPV